MTGPDRGAADSAATDSAAAEIVAAGRELHDLGLSPGASGNISVREADGFRITPTGVALGGLTEDGLGRLDGAGRPLPGSPPPTKEVPLHLALYERFPELGAVVHLHSTHAVAVSCLEPVPPQSAADVLPPLTPYSVMRLGTVPLLPYAAPGSPALAAPVAGLASGTRAVLLANHGPVTTGAVLRQAVAAAVELEETATLHLLLTGRAVRPLTPAQRAELPTRPA